MSSLTCLSERPSIDALDVLAPQTDVIRLRRRVGMIFQKPNPFPLSIREEPGVTPARARAAG